MRWVLINFMLWIIIPLFFWALIIRLIIDDLTRTQG